MKRVIVSLFILSVLAMSPAFGETQKKEGPLKIVFLGESSSSDIGWAYQVDCMKQAAAALGVTFSYRFAEGDYARHADMILEEAARGVDAIIGPWWDATLYNKAITEAVKKGVLVFGVSGIAPRDTLPVDVARKCGWQSSELGPLGEMMARYAFPLIPNNAKIFWPAEVPSGTYITEPLRTFKEYFQAKGKKITVDVVDCTSDATTAEQRIVSYLTANPNVAAVVTTGALCINAANLAAKEIGLKPGKIPIIGQVVSPASARGIKEGYMPFGVNWNLTNIGYYAVIKPWAILKLGANPTYDGMDYLYIDKNNLERDVPAVFLK